WGFNILAIFPFSSSGSNCGKNDAPAIQTVHKRIKNATRANTDFPPLIVLSGGASSNMNITAPTIEKTKKSIWKTKGNSSAVESPTSAPPTTNPITSFLITFPMQILVLSTDVRHPTYLALAGTGLLSGSSTFELDDRRATNTATLTTVKKTTVIPVIHQ